MPKAYPVGKRIFVWHDDDFHDYFAIEAEHFARIDTDGNFATIHIDGKGALCRFDNEFVEPDDDIAFVLLHSRPSQASTPRLFAGLATRSKDDESQPGTVYLFC